MTLRRRMELLSNTFRPRSAREKRLAMRFSRQDKIVRWIGAANRRKMQDETLAAASVAAAAPPGKVIVLTWKQTFGRSAARSADPVPMSNRTPALQMGSKLLAFRAN